MENKKDEYLLIVVSEAAAVEKGVESMFSISVIAEITSS